MSVLLRRLAIAVAVPVVLAGVFAAPARAADDDDDEAIEYRQMRFAERGTKKGTDRGRLVVSGSFTDVFDAQLLENLDSGFTTTVVLRAYVYLEGSENVPVAYAAATFVVLYDLWEEVYEVTLVDDTVGERKTIVYTQADALKAITTLDRFTVAPLKRIARGKTYFLGVIVEVNPVSEELLAEVRRWMGRDSGDKGVAGNSSFFGSFVSVFVNPKIAEADRTLKFRARFYRPEKK